MSGEFSVLGLDHVTVTTPEELEAETVAWYEHRLGLERIAKPEGTRSAGAWFRAGALQSSGALQLPPDIALAPPEDFSLGLTPITWLKPASSSSRVASAKHSHSIIDAVGADIVLFDADSPFTNAPS